MEQKSNLYIPGAIILAGFLVATGIYLTNKKDLPVKPDDQVAVKSIVVSPITKEDHLLGNPNADISIIEYSDTECPFCKRYHTTIQNVIDTYGKDGKVAWVYRHFPLDSIHPKTRKEAEATECANELGGNTAFWSVINSIYTNTPANNGLDAAKLPVFAKSAGLDVNKFNTCLASGKYAASVEADFQSGVKIGIRGTPYSIMILKSPVDNNIVEKINSYALKNQLIDQQGNPLINVVNSNKNITVNGAVPFEYLKAIIDMVLK
jgi:protein-disulfide isomerase